MFRRVRAEVLASTNGAQRPHEYHSLVGEQTSVTVSAVAAADPAPAGDRHHRAAHRCPSLRYASWPRPETPRRRPSSANGTKRVAASDETMGSLCLGSAERPTRAILLGRLHSATCTAPVEAWGTTWSPCRGTVARPSRETFVGSTTSASCSTTVVLGVVRTPWRTTDEKACQSHTRRWLKTGAIAG